ncbi:GcrA family cell cycle regulator [Commensalibacter nepenthis]|uniref:GcrA family cell cycle regulator n=1 Tax=Commensalibacter nepenthis TaxID=3043872 RepID=A0ABT6Q8A4_9PROT|nr:GcrA family cell cycle regulator [Commensalibacter sp. TBRC 10068]MDI2113139.1 GcrA family cell cycle regulator [Commensalibacter sp. TBRC 10068]
MEWNEEAVARLKELWAQGLSTAEIGRHLNVTKNAVVGKAHRLGLEGRPSPIRRAAAAKKEKVVAPVAAKPERKPEEKAVKVAKPKAEKIEKVQKEKLAPAVNSAKTAEVTQLEMVAPVVKKEVKPAKKTKIEFSTPVELPKRRSMSDCCWPIGDPGTKDFHFCGAKAIPGKPYCLEHVQIAYVKLRDRKNNVA